MVMYSYEISFGKFKQEKRYSKRNNGELFVVILTLYLVSSCFLIAFILYFGPNRVILQYQLYKITSVL